MNSKFVSFKQNTTLYMNHLLVVYAFLLPISQRALSTIFTLVLILFIIRGNFKYYLSYSFNNKIVQACLLYFIIHIFWLIGTDDFIYAQTILDDMKYLIFPFVFLSFLDKKFTVRIITSFILGMLFSEIISYLIHFNILPNEINYLGYEVYKVYYHGNPTPFLAHTRYNVLLSIVISMLLYNLLKNFRTNSIFINTISIFFILTASFNITIVAGRIGYISYIVLIFFTLFLVFRKRIIKVFIPFLILLSVFLYISYNNEGMFSKRVNQTIESVKKIVNESSYNSSIGYRISFWISSYAVIKDNFLFGVGTGDHMQSVRKYEKDLEREKILHYLSNSHNEYLKSFLQFGVIGFIFFINIYYQIFKSETKNDIDVNILYISTVGIMIGTLSSMFGSKVYLPFLMLIASIVSADNDLLGNYQSPLSIKHILSYCFFGFILYIYAIIQ